MRSATLNVKGRDIRIKTAYDVAVIEGLKAIGASWDRGCYAWTYPATVFGVVKLVKTLRALGLTCLTDDMWIKVAMDKAHRAADLMLDGANLSPFTTHSPLPLFRHQRFVIEMTKVLPAVYCAHGMGTGKTRTAIEAISAIGAKRVLITCPKISIMETWVPQFEKYHDGRLSCVPIANGTMKHKARVARQALAAGPAAIIINHESVWRKQFADFATSIDWDLIVIDEAHRIANESSKVSTFFQELSWHAEHKLALSGTPSRGSPLDLWAQMAFLDPGMLGPDFKAFKRAHCIYGGRQQLPRQCFKCHSSIATKKPAHWQCTRCNKVYLRYNDPMDICYECGGPVVQLFGMQGMCTGCGKVFEAKPVEIIGYKNIDELHRQFYQLAHRVRTDDALDLPASTCVTLTVTLSAEEKRIYKEMSHKLAAAVRDGTITAANGMVKLLRLQQITGGSSKDDDGNVVTFGTSKRDRLIEDLKDLPLDEPVVVFCRFTHDLAQVREAATACGRIYRELSGHTDELKDWQTGEPAVLGVQISSGGISIDLTRARYVYCYSVGFSLVDYEQALARVHRQGQTRNVCYRYLIASGTIDRDVYAALDEKRDVVGVVIDALKSNRKMVQA